MQPVPPMPSVPPMQTGYMAVKKAPFNVRKLIIPAAAVLAAAIAVVALLIIITANNPKYGTFKGDVSIIHPNNGSSTSLFVDGVKADTVDGAVYLDYVSGSLDGTKCVFEDGDYTLYLFDGKLNKISDNASGIISTDGNSVAYVKFDDDGSSFGELCLYTNGNSTTIEKKYSLNCGCVISPNGKTVAYWNTDEDGKTTGYYYDGKVHELGRDIMPIAVSNGARCVYFTKNNKLYVQNGDNEDSRVKLSGGSISNVAFNRDFTEVVYSSDSDNEIYISKNGGEKIRLGVADYDFPFLMPQKTAVSSYFNTSISIYDTASFTDTYYRVGYRVYHINGNYEAEEVENCSVSGTAYLSSDGKTIYYLDDDELYRIDGSAKKAEPEELADDVRDFYLTDDGQSFFYLNDDMELFYQRGSGKPTMISDDGGYGYIQGKTLYYVVDNELYTSDGSKGKLVTGIDGEVQGVTVKNCGVEVVTQVDDGYNYYYFKDGKNFKLMLSENK